MKKLVFAAACLVAGPAIAQAPLVLIEACNAILEADKRLECLKAAMGSNAAAAKPQAIDAISGAFAAMQASIGVGISYSNYQVAMLDLAKALAAYKQEVGEAGRESAKFFDAAVEAYSDVGVFWERSIAFYARRSNEVTYSGGLPVSMNGLEWLVAKYSLGTVKSDILGIERGLPVQMTRAQIWVIAKQKADEAMRVARLPSAKSGSPPDTEMQAVHMLVKTQQCREYPVAEKNETEGTSTLYSAVCTDGRKLKISCSAGACRVMP